MRASFRNPLVCILVGLVASVPMAFADQKIDLPPSIGAWTRPDSPQVIVKNNIFEYMDGAGELYLGYRFDHLDVYEYTATDQYSILVELYWMKSSDDAFGLLSLDWGGESVTLTNWPNPPAPTPHLPNSEALYGAGLLRLWSDDLYARVMAYQENPASRNAVLQLGRAIVSGRKTVDSPKLLSVLPLNLSGGWQLQPDRVSYLRNHLVLNSLYYLSSENLLDLDLTTEAVFASYANPAARSRSIKLLVCRYPESLEAEKALSHFRTVYLPESQSKLSQSSCYQIEDGWMGFAQHGTFVVLVFEASDEMVIQSILEQFKVNLTNFEGEP